MVNLIPESVKTIWDNWNIQAFMILSLSLQTFLILFSPLRKRTNKLWLISFIWSAYLLADWAAAFAIGLISNSQTNIDNLSPAEKIHGNIWVFWAPFLLLHLGGPDTITAFSLEDNALWLRHLFGLIFQCLAVMYVFIQSFPSEELLVPTVLLFIAGTIKYAERTRALYLASLDTFRSSIMKSKPESDFDYADYIEEHDALLKQGFYSMVNVPNFVNLNARISVEGNLGELDVVQHAYYFFEIYKGVLVDLVINRPDGSASGVYFDMRTPEDAFRVITVELNFFYQVLYTKVVVVRSKMGYIVRLVSFIVTAVSFFLFYSLEKRGLNNVDVKITYTLLFGAMALEAIAFFMLIFSDWTVAALASEGDTLGCPSTPTSWKSIIQKTSPWITTILKKYLKLRRPNWSTKESSNLLDRVRRVLFRRWSESVSCYNLIDYCLKESPKMKHNNIIFNYLRFIYIKLLDFFGLKEFRDKIKYISSKPLSKELWDFIFQEQKKRGFDEETTESNDWKNVCEDILRTYVDGVDFDQRLLMWHIATEICYNVEDKDCIVNINDLHKREYSKILSDYMLYLLIMQPTMMTLISGIAQARFRDTCAEAKKIFSQSKLGAGVLEQKLACRRILEMNVELDPVKGDDDKSVLFHASILAKELDQKLKEEKWRLMSQVWVDMLSHAARNCELTSHAQLLSSGGELITFVWLLMVHFAKAGHLQRSRGGRFVEH